MRIPLALASLTLAACSADPAVTDSYPWDELFREPLVSVCYGAGGATRAELEALARENCPVAGSSVRFIDHEGLWNDCPLLLKNRATFACAAPPAE